MLETGNCPNCGTLCKFELEIATCEMCKTKWRKRENQVSGKIVYEKWVCRIPELTLSFPYILSNVKFGPKLCGWKVVTPKRLPTGNLGVNSQATSLLKGKIVEERIAVPPKEPAFYEFDLVRDDTVEGTIVSDRPLDIWFIYERNIDRFLKHTQNFEPEDVTLGIYEAKIEFKAKRKGLFYVAIEHSEKESVKVEVNIYSLRTTT